MAGQAQRACGWCKHVLNCFGSRLRAAWVRLGCDRVVAYDVFHVTEEDIFFMSVQSSCFAKSGGTASPRPDTGVGLFVFMLKFLLYIRRLL